MAYLNSQDTKAIRTALKKAFPQFKLSITNRHGSGVSIKILSGPTNFGFKEYTQFHPAQFDRIQDGEILKQMREVMHKAVGNYDNSDIMTDYFEVGYYEWFSLGDWNKPFTLTK